MVTVAATVTIAALAALAGVVADAAAIVLTQSANRLEC